MNSSENQISAQQKKRINYIDALRGFTMFLVVFGHVIIFGLDINLKESVISSFFLTFRMPMFFFISGYIAFKSSEKWTFSFYKKMLRKKAVVQIIPTVIFFTLYSMTIGFPITKFVEFGFGGYWFTIVLFELFCFYFSFSLLSHVTKKHQILDIGMIICSIIGIIWLNIGDRSGSLSRILCFENLTKYFQFFTFGLLCRKYQNFFIKAVGNDYFKAILIFIFVIAFYFYFDEGFKNSFSIFFHFNHDILVRYVGLLIVFSYFYHKRHFFDQEGKIQTIFTFVGKRTLDIYLLHYFFIPDITIITDWISPNNRMVILLIVAGLVAICVIAFCLLISDIIRMSQFLGHYCFGAKI